MAKPDGGLSASRRKQLLAGDKEAYVRERIELYEGAKEDAFNAEKAIDRNSARRAASEILDKSWGVLNTLTDDDVKHAEQLLEELRRLQAQQSGARPERITVPEDPKGSEPVH